MELAFLSLAALVILAPPLALVWAQRRYGLEPAWYGLIVLGAAAAVAARVVQMGLWLIYQALAPLPPGLTAEQVAGRWDVLLLAAFALGPLVEASKSYAVIFFDTRLSRGDQTLYGVAVGAGAGWVQALWYLGAVGWTVAWGQHQAGAAELVLALRELLHVFMETALCTLVMYFVARKQRWPAVLGLGALHGAALLLMALAASCAQPWLRLGSGPALYGLVGAGALLALWWQVRRRGWPM